MCSQIVTKHLPCKVIPQHTTQSVVEAGGAGGDPPGKKSPPAYLSISAEIFGNFIYLSISVTKNVVPPSHPVYLSISERNFHIFDQKSRFFTKKILVPPDSGGPPPKKSPSISIYLKKKLQKVPPNLSF